MGRPIAQLLVVGLGNLPLPLTRHSVGHLIVDSLASRLGISLASQKGGYVGHGHVYIGETPVSLTLFKSKSLMNISGPSVSAVYRKTCSDPKSLVVVSDSVQHDVAKLSVRLGGSPNGHNGVKSIISALGGEQNFWRFRAGVGYDNSDMVSYVLGRLSNYEKQFWTQEGLDLVLADLERVARKNG
ncbi:peptidyl-tRNA hydrolase [Macrolepiota fuliginosa MF-IS2]|uniref:peptidyl-tRNA hydrolase n=1 Tax=Macrolepiota fuliginosa MF-IS2 TaxID=1400762 RepID=A0A9P5XH87_9AGAR|nr:peptidyl-tRNA hydrolase [Macrolepiota fuliginosa MF-IS2]